MKLKIEVRRINKNIPLPQVIGKGDWIDLYSSDTVKIEAPQAETLKKHIIDGKTVSHRDVKFNWELIPLGIAMKLPKGFEAIVVPRSSTFKNFGIIQTNSIGVIDNTYSGDNDEWLLPITALTDTTIPEGSKICQFRIQLSQKATLWQKLKWLLSSGIQIVEVKHLNDQNRGGFGTTGTR